MLVLDKISLLVFYVELANKFAGIMYLLALLAISIELSKMLAILKLLT
jgi:hypothetical protein